MVILVNKILDRVLWLGVDPQIPLDQVWRDLDGNFPASFLINLICRKSPSLVQFQVLLSVDTVVAVYSDTDFSALGPPTLKGLKNF